MSKWLLAVLLASSTGLHALENPAAQNSITSASAKRFLEQYTKAQKEKDKTATNMFADGARLHGVRYTDFESNEIFSYSFKEAMANISMTGKQHPLDSDISTYSDVKVEEGKRFTTIRALRYSNSRCYVDPNFKLVIQRDIAGFIEIVEERREIHAYASCETVE